MIVIIGRLVKTVKICDAPGSSLTAPSSPNRTRRANWPVSFLN